MGFILHETEIGGYYGGQNKKHGDMFNLTVREHAKVLNEEDALRIKNTLNKRDYNFVVEPV